MSRVLLLHLGYARWVIGAYDKAIPWAEWVAARHQPAGLGDRSGAQLRLRVLPEGKSE